MNGGPSQGCRVEIFASGIVLVIYYTLRRCGSQLDALGTLREITQQLYVLSVPKASEKNGTTTKF